MFCKCKSYNCKTLRGTVIIIIGITVGKIKHNNYWLLKVIVKQTSGAMFLSANVRLNSINPKVKIMISVIEKLSLKF